MRQRLDKKVTEERVETIAYSGYRGEESPRAFILDGKRIEILQVMEQWIEEDAATKKIRRCFRVKGDDFATHLLSHLEVDGVWLHG